MVLGKDAAVPVRWLANVHVLSWLVGMRSLPFRGRPFSPEATWGHHKRTDIANRQSAQVDRGSDNHRVYLKY